MQRRLKRRPRLLDLIGIATGQRFFGNHDWYRELARRVLDSQNQNGSWGDDLMETSYALLFLARGRHPIMMNKLRFDGFWSNRPREVANVANFMSRELERPLNWQVVDITRTPADWADSPILFMASSKAPMAWRNEASPAQALSRYVERWSAGKASAASRMASLLRRGSFTVASRYAFTAPADCQAKLTASQFPVIRHRIPYQPLFIPRFTPANPTPRNWNWP